MAFFYRGVSKQQDLECGGHLVPKGRSSKFVARYDGNLRYDGTFTYSKTEDNAARAHQIQSGLYDGCFVSTTKDLEVATRFATNVYTQEGWIYVIDTTLFEWFGISFKEFERPNVFE